MQHDDDEVFVDLLRDMLGDLADPMTYEQAAKDAIADFRSEQQQSRIQFCEAN